MSRRLSFASLILLVGLVQYVGSGWSVSAQTNFVLTSATTPMCSAAQRIAWEEVWNQSNGIAGEDPIGNFIGFRAALGNTDADEPVYTVNDVVKRTLCGRLIDFHIADIAGPEWDWSSLILPAPHYADLLVSHNSFGGAITYANLDCEDGINNCMYVEITPHATLKHNPWFDYPTVLDYVGYYGYKLPGKTPLIGNYLCTYGPWVADNGHDSRAEIHPSELLWWRYGRSAYLLMVQDDSDRFDRTTQFQGDSSELEFHPWSENPRNGKFKVAFSLNPSRGAARFEVFQENVRNVNGDVTDADDGRDHALEYDGKVLLEVEEIGYPDSNVQVTFEDVCRLPDNRLLGYVGLKGQVGFNDHGGEGFQLLRVDQFTQPGGDDVGPPLPLPVLPLPSRLASRLPTNNPRVIMRTIILPETVGLAPSREGYDFFGDLKVSMILQPKAKVGESQIRKIDLLRANRRQSLSFEPLRKGDDQIDAEAIVKNVPLFLVDAPIKRPGESKAVPYKSSALEITTKSGDSTIMILPVVSLAPVIRAAEPRLSSSAEKDRLAVYRAVGINPVELKRLLKQQGANLLRISQWQISAAPQYASLKDGETSPEDNSPFANALNHALRSEDEARIRTLFGSEQPFKVNWTFAAVNLSSGTKVGVRVGAKATSTRDASVEYLSGKLPNANLKVSFPEQPSAVYELTATAAFTDKFGRTGQVKHHLYSHVISNSTSGGLITAMLPMIATHAGMTERELMSYSSFDKAEIQNRVTQKAKAARARSLRLFTMRAASDKRVTVGEFRNLLAIAKHFKNN